MACTNWSDRPSSTWRIYGKHSAGAFRNSDAQLISLNKSLRTGRSFIPPTYPESSAVIEIRAS
jgi:hypothetical protein